MKKGSAGRGAATVASSAVDSGPRDSRASPVTRTRSLRPLWRRLMASGCDVGALERRYELPATTGSDEEIVVTLHTLAQLHDEAAALLQDPALGVHLAIDHPPGTLGILEYTFRFAATAREACRQVARYVGLVNDLAQMAFEEPSTDELAPGESAGVGHVRHWVAGHPLALGRHLNEYFMSLLVLRLRQFTGAAVVPRAVWFAHPRPADIRPLVEVFRCSSIEFGVEANGVSFDKATLDIRLPTVDKELSELLGKVAEEKLAALPQARDFTSHVRRVVRAGMQGAVPKMPEVAASFRMSERTFQRRLADEGTSYQGVVEAVRDELARLHVADSKLSFGEVAYLLGYAELSAFLRAFKRWTGQTPQAFRQQEAATQGAKVPSAASAGRTRRR